MQNKNEEDDIKPHARLRRKKEEQAFDDFLIFIFKALWWLHALAAAVVKGVTYGIFAIFFGPLVWFF